MTHRVVADVDGQAGDTEPKNGIGDRSALPLAPVVIAVGRHQHRNYLLHEAKLEHVHVAGTTGPGVLACRRRPARRSERQAAGRAPRGRWTNEIPTRSAGPDEVS